ncbi:universal stress protein [Pseudodesulfovibrio thermohalotolerans]|uniref:universal stress protein n=1 Tax=Pseudodesulfovibrio thermohalotolerans TaxID=2880651 RepID=UPI0022BA0405|nr:universal stress protein [Pseudodesulfovibrio thermohalotolerans]WFS63099.1 universal stress protein [Pseudodesulfovibrio thermohalotolerans]
MDSILLATTGEAHCMRAEDYALKYCALNRTSLDIIHVVEDNLSHYGMIDSLATEGDRRDFIAYSQKVERPEVERRLARITGKAESMNINYRLYIEWKSPLYCILKHIRHVKSQLLVVGGRKRRHNPFSLVRCLSRKASCEVMQVL